MMSKNLYVQFEKIDDSSIQSNPINQSANAHNGIPGFVCVLRRRGTMRDKACRRLSSSSLVDRSTLSFDLHHHHQVELKWLVHLLLLLYELEAGVVESP